MSFSIKKEGEIVVVDVEGQLIVGNRQELKQKVLDELERGEKKFLIDFCADRIHRQLRARRARLAVEEDPRAGRRAASRQSERRSQDAVRAHEARHAVPDRRHARPRAAELLTIADPPHRRAATVARATPPAPCSCRTHGCDASSRRDGLRVRSNVEIPSDVRYIERVVELVRRECAELAYDASVSSCSTSPSRSPRRSPTPSCAATATIRPSTSTCAPRSTPSALVVEVADEGEGFDLDAYTRRSDDAGQPRARGRPRAVPHAQADGPRRALRAAPQRQRRPPDAEPRMSELGEVLAAFHDGHAMRGSRLDAAPARPTRPPTSIAGTRDAPTLVELSRR